MSTDTPTRKPNKPKKRKNNKKRNHGYTSTSPAVCIVLYDIAGRPMPDKIATEFVNIAADLADKYGYVINFTRQ